MADDAAALEVAGVEVEEPPAEVLELIRERDFPVEIDEAAPSLYAKYEEDRREGGALALTTGDFDS